MWTMRRLQKHAINYHLHLSTSLTDNVHILRLFFPTIIIMLANRCNREVSIALTYSNMAVISSVKLFSLESLSLFVVRFHDIDGCEKLCYI